MSSSFKPVLLAMGVTEAISVRYADVLLEACNQFSINTPKRQAAFLAQTGHESGMFRTVVENLNYSAKGLIATWPSRFTKEQAEAMERKPEKIANHVYANRMGNGDESSGDGWRYKGRGFIQVTGKNNYTACGKALELDLVKHPELLEEPLNASLSAAWFWQSNSLNGLADIGEFDKITKKINGGTNGSDHRRELWAKAKKALGI